MELSSDLIVIMFLLINLQTGVIIALIDSRHFWRKKWLDNIERSFYE